MTCPYEKAFKKSVNMTPREIRAWQKDHRAKCYSKPETRARLEKLATLKEKPGSAWTEADCTLAARVVSFNARMEGGQRRDGCTPGYAVSLRNWGRKTSCAVPKTCSPSKVARGLGRTENPLEKRARKGVRKKSDPKSLVSVSEAIARVKTKYPTANLDVLPGHIVPFGRYMKEAASKLPTKREIIKAYVVTRSSVQRQGATKPTLCQRWPDYSPLKRQADPRKVRPEDAMAAALFLPVGQRYLNAAEKGRFDEDAAREIVALMGCYGLTDSLLRDMRDGVKLGERAPEVRKALKGPAVGWWRFLEKRTTKKDPNPGVPGIGPSKAGFFASLLGRGDIPTFDARELDLWQRDRKTAKLEPGWKEVEALQRRLKAFPMKVPKDLEPFKVHLVHHALWDAYGDTPRPSKTTHGAPIRAMQFAGAKRRKKR